MVAAISPADRDFDRFRTDAERLCEPLLRLRDGEWLAELHTWPAGNTKEYCIWKAKREIERIKQYNREASWR
jgi:hypothetical protein